MQTPNLMDWLKENLQRLFEKSPKFFQIWQIIFLVLTLVTGLPQFLATIGIILPEELAVLANKYIAYASLAALFMASLTTQSKPVGVMPSGQVVKKTDPELKFTVKAEAKEAAKVNTGGLQVNIQKL